MPAALKEPPVPRPGGPGCAPTVPVVPAAAGSKVKRGETAVPGALIWCCTSVMKPPCTPVAGLAAVRAPGCPSAPRGDAAGDTLATLVSAPGAAPPTLT